MRFEKEESREVYKEQIYIPLTDSCICVHQTRLESLESYSTGASKYNAFLQVILAADKQ